MDRQEYFAKFEQLAVLCCRFNTNFIEGMKGSAQPSFRRLLEIDMAAAYDDPELFKLFEEGRFINPSESRQYMLEMPRLTRSSNLTRDYPSLHDLTARISLLGYQMQPFVKRHIKSFPPIVQRYGLKGNVPSPEQTLDELSNATCLLELVNTLEEKGALSKALTGYSSGPQPEGQEVASYALFKEQLGAIGKLAGALAVALEAQPELADKTLPRIDGMDTHML